MTLNEFIAAVEFAIGQHDFTAYGSFDQPRLLQLEHEFQFRSESTDANETAGFGFIPTGDPTLARITTVWGSKGAPFDLRCENDPTGELFTYSDLHNRIIDHFQTLIF